MEIIVKRRRKARFDSLKQCRPSREKPVAVHPLIPREGGVLHVKFGGDKFLLIMNVLIVKKLSSFEYPSHGIIAIKVGYFKFHVWTKATNWGRCWWIFWGGGNKSKGNKMFQKGVHLGVHVCLSLG